MGERKAFGFTLIEVLAVLLLSALVFGAAAQSVSLTLGFERGRERALARRDELEAADRVLRPLIERMDPGGVSGRPPLFAGTERSMVFTTTLPEAAAGQIARLSDVTIALEGGHRLVLAWVPHLPNLIDSGAARGRTVLMEGIDGFSIAYWRQEGGWTPHWTGRDVPALIRLRIRLSAKDLNSFPDIVVRTRRDRWRP